MRSDLDWQHREGRDSSGDKFSHEVLVHGSSRILAKVYCPVAADDYNFEVAFFATVESAKKDLRDERDMRFMDVESAKRFAEASLAEFSEGPAQAGVGKAGVAERDKVDCAI